MTGTKYYSTTGRYVHAFFLVFFLLFCSVGNTGSDEGKPAPKKDKADPMQAARQVGQIMDDQLTECSGLEISPSTGDLFWAINDSNNGPYLHALGSDGRSRGRVLVEDAPNRDWEALDTFLWQGRPMILIADTGDNFGWYNTHILYIVDEPRINGERFDESAAVKPAWRITFSYPDRNHDAEGVAVDAAGDKVLILTKGDNPPLLFELPLNPIAAGKPLMARKISAVGWAPPAAEALKQKYGFFRSPPTAMDISKDGLQAVVLTHKHACLFMRDSGSSWAAAFSRPPAPIPLNLPRKEKHSQREAICFAADDKGFFVTSEGKRAGIYRVEAGTNRDYKTSSRRGFSPSPLAGEGRDGGERSPRTTR